MSSNIELTNFCDVETSDVGDIENESKQIVDDVILSNDDDDMRTFFLLTNV